jgi:hypothetical protein
MIGDPGEFEKSGDATGAATGKNATLEPPPPGKGFTTSTMAVLVVAMSAAGTTAVSRELETNVVVSWEPSQFTVDPETNPVPFTVSVNPDPPGAAAAGTRGWLMKGTGFALEFATPAPVRPTICGLSDASSTIVKAPVNDPVLAGSKVIDIEQLAPTANVAGETGQSFVWAKLETLVAMLDIVSAAVPLLVKVMVLAGLVELIVCEPKSKLVADTATAEPPPPPVTPVPLKVTAWGLSGALSKIESVPDSVPVVVGVKLTLIVQSVLVARLDPQSLVSLKLVLTVMAVMFSDVLPVLVSVTGCDALVVPTVCDENVVGAT